MRNDVIGNARGHHKPTPRACPAQWFNAELVRAAFMPSGVPVPFVMLGTNAGSPMARRFVIFKIFVRHFFNLDHHELNKLTTPRCRSDCAIRELGQESFDAQ
jgi:hypothetical protein